MKKIIWVIDDEESILEVMHVLLEEQNHTVKVFSNPADVIVGLDTHEKPDVICLDVHLSGGDGREVAKQIKSHKNVQDVPILLMTADVHIEEKAKEAQADDFLQKPFGMQDFLNKVDTILNRKKS